MRGRQGWRMAPWLSATVLLCCVVAGWLVMRWETPLPEGLRLPVAIALVVLGFAGWWRGAAWPHACSSPGRRWTFSDLLPPGAALTAFILALAGLIGYGSSPLENIADRLVGDVFRGGTEEVDPAEPVEDEFREDERAVQWEMDQWLTQQVPDQMDGLEPDAPPVLLQFRDEGAFQRLIENSVYVRIAALDRFELENDSWFPEPVEPSLLRAEEEGANEGWVLIPDAPPPSARDVRWNIFSPLASQVVPSLQGATAISVAEIERFGKGLWQMPEPGANSFDGRSLSVTFKELSDVERWAAMRYGAAERPQWLALPSGGIGDQLQALAKEIAGDDPPHDAALRIPEWLASQCAYGTTFTNPDGLSALENFLFGEQVGACEHYATAGVLLLRAMGIPARIAYGYSGGTADAEREIIQFAGQDYHAWAEIWVPDLGWAVMECTPPGEGASRPPQMGVEEEEEDEEEDEAGIAVDEGEEEALVDSGPPGGTVLLILAAAFALFAWLFAWWRGKGLRRAAAAAAAAGDRWGGISQPRYFTEFLEACNRLGLGRRPGRTALEHLGFLYRADVLDTRLEQMIHYYYRTRYEGAAADAGREQQWLNDIARWQESMRTRMEQGVR